MRRGVPSRPFQKSRTKPFARGFRLAKLAIGHRISSMWSGLGTGVVSDGAADRQFEDVREMMLTHLGMDHVLGSSLFRRIQYADDIQVLWYLRSDLMSSLAALHGEGVARSEMSSITKAFQGALPHAMRPHAAPARH